MEETPKPVHTLVLDTGAIIKNVFEGLTHVPNEGEPEAAAAEAMFLPLKLERKPVEPMLVKAPELPKALIWQARPSEAEQAALAEVLGAVKICPPEVPGSMGEGTFWKTLPSATMRG